MSTSNSKPPERFVSICGDGSHEEILWGNSRDLCAAPVYSSGSSVPVKDSPPPIMLEIKVEFSNTLFVLGSVCIAIFLFSLVAIVTNPSSKAIKNSQPFAMIMICFGCIVGSIDVILFGLRPDKHICSAQLWFGTVSQIVIFSSVYVKMWRIDRLVNRLLINKLLFLNRIVVEITSVVMFFV